jgi:hypothetical protein
MQCCHTVTSDISLHALYTSAAWLYVGNNDGVVTIIMMVPFVYRISFHIVGLEATLALKPKFNSINCAYDKMKINMSINFVVGCHDVTDICLLYSSSRG